MAFSEHPVPRKRGPTGEPLPGLRFPRPPFRWSRSTLHKEARRSRARPRARRGQRDHDLRPQYPLPKWRRSRVVAGQSLMRRARPAHQTPSVCTCTTKKITPGRQGTRFEEEKPLLCPRPSPAFAFVGDHDVVGFDQRRRAGRATHRLAHRVLVVLRRVLLSLGWWHCSHFGG
jgi:hypothetical protein